MKPIKIIGTGRYLPPKSVSNEELSKVMDTSDEWIRDRTGIRARRVVEGNTATSHLAAKAIENACADAGIEPAQLDGIIVGTCSPDTLFPSTACWVQDHLQVRGMPAFDVMAGCSSFLYGLEVASNWVAGNPNKRVAVCGAEVFSKILNWDDRRTSVLFGDGAGAAIVSGRVEGDSGILASNWGSDGTLASILQVPAGGTRMPATHATVDERAHTVYMEGSKVFKHAVTAMSQGLLDALATAGVGPEDIDVFIPHQANLRISEAAQKALGLSDDRIYNNIDRYGNTTAASIPLAIDECVRSGKLVKGDVLVVAAFGAGFTWGSAVIRL